MDSVLILTDIALSFDNHLEEAYYLKGAYFREKVDPEQALEYYETALNINPNYAMALMEIGGINIFDLDDFVRGISSYQKAASIDRSSLPDILLNLGWAYAQVKTQKG